VLPRRRRSIRVRKRREDGNAGAVFDERPRDVAFCVKYVADLRVRHPQVVLPAGVEGIRLWLGHDVDLELTFGRMSLLSIVRVVSDGIRPLVDKDRLLQAVSEAVRKWWMTASARQE
jgi:hypothetical protein